MGLLRLAPEIQEHVLSLPDMIHRPAVTERALRPIAQLERASDQKARFLPPVAGGGAHDRFGHSVSIPTDLNNDGVVDILVGAIQTVVCPSTCMYTGNGYVFALSGTGGSILCQWQGTLFGDQLGWVVADIGDLNGNGSNEFVLSAPQYGANNGGWAQAYHGGFGCILAPAIPTPWIGTGPCENGVGHAVAAIGDVDLDGVNDVLIGSPSSDFQCVSETGIVRIHSGVTGAELLAVGGAFYDKMGIAVAGVGDVDGDGKPDFAVGAPTANPFGSGVNSQGYVRIYSSGTGAILHQLDGAGQGEGFGWALAEVGDVDGDGQTDLAVGAPQKWPLVGNLPTGGWLPNKTGYVKILGVQQGGPPVELMNVEGLAADEEMGAAVANGGDGDGDGFPDILVGAPGGNRVKLVSYAGIPPGSAILGSGCAGSGGFVPRITTAGGLPSVAAGNAGFRVYVSQALGGRPAILVMSASSLNPAVNLGGLGLAGCNLYVPLHFLWTRVTGGVGPGDGRAWVSIPVPVVPSGVGARVYFQWYVGDPGPALIPGAMSAALELKLL